MILPVLIFPDKRLRIKAKPVAYFDAKLKKLIKNMYETMYAENGIGLAATQVNTHQQVIVMDVPSEQEYYDLQAARVDTTKKVISTQHSPICLINPVILAKQGEVESKEGCLSVPEFNAFVSRYETITVQAQNEQGELFELDVDGLLAICIQHEMDHLQGKLFVDYLSKLKFERLKKKYEKLEW